MRENLILFAKKVTIFAKRFDDFFRKMLQLLQENLTVFSGNSDDFCTKVWWSLQEHLTIFQGNLMILAVKSADPYFQLVDVFFIAIILIQAILIRFCCKNRQIFLWKLPNFPEEFVKFFCEYRQIFLQLPTVKFFYKNYQLSIQKLSKFYCQNVQILPDFRIKNIKFNFLANIVKFLYKSCQIFLQRWSALPTKIVIFSRKKH